MPSQAQQAPKYFSTAGTISKTAKNAPVVVSVPRKLPQGKKLFIPTLSAGFSSGEPTADPTLNQHKNGDGKTPFPSPTKNSNKTIKYQKNTQNTKIQEQTQKHASTIVKEN